MATLDEKMDVVMTTVVQMQGDLAQVKEQMITREQCNDALTKEDTMMVILQRLDQERVATISWIERLEAEIVALKRHVHLV